MTNQDACTEGFDDVSGFLKDRSDTLKLGESSLFLVLMTSSNYLNHCF
ncbi:unnamed protein product, partial [Vitis vinifera]